MAAAQAKRNATQGREVSILTRSVENVFRNLVRLLVGRMTLRRLLDLMREIFIQEAESLLRRERPGKNVALSQLALLTGLDTRTLIRVRGQISARQAAGHERIRIEDLSSEARVVEMWARNARYRDPQDDSPRPLTYGSPGSEFEELVREVVKARGVTTQSILERLLGTQSVAQDPESGLLRLITERYSPFDSQHEMSLMSNGMQAIINLTGTVGRNVLAPQEGRHIQREVWTFRLDPARRAEFNGKVREFLLEMEQQAARVMTPLESDTQHDDQITAGVGFYYFEEDPRD